MAFLSTNVAGSGTLYDFSTSDLNVYLLEGVRYLRTGGSGPTIMMDVAGANFIVGGSIYSNSYGIEVTGLGAHTIQITADGVVSSSNLEAIRVGAGAPLVVANAGLIQAFNQPAIRMLASTTSSLTLINSGTIQSAVFGVAVQATNGVDRITNTGVILGGVQLGDGADVLDNRLGQISGTIEGGAGDDLYWVNGSETIVETISGGDDEVRAFADFILPRYVEELTLMGAARVGHGNSSDNRITGTEGDDTLYGQAGDDLVNGEDGHNRLYGGVGDDVLFTGVGDDEGWGGAGDDIVSLGVGDNRLHGGVGDDTLTAGSGDDEAWGGSGNDLISLSAGTNRAFGEGGDDTIYSSTGEDYLDGGAGIDLVDYSLNAGTGVNVNLATGAASGGAAQGDVLVSFEHVVGSPYADIITGSSLANVLMGGEGDDQLFGGQGDDLLEGGVGADLMDGGQGVDRIDYSQSEAGVTVNLTTGVGTGGEAQGDTYVSVENVTGTVEADTITGNVYANVLRGGAGDDYLLGEQGNDVLEGGAGDDRLHGGPGSDVFLFADIVTGTPGGWGADDIQLFQDGLDRISFVGASGVNSIADLTITTQSGYVSIMTASGDEIRLMGFVGTLDVADFVFN